MKLLQVKNSLRAAGFVLATSFFCTGAALAAAIPSSNLRLMSTNAQLVHTLNSRKLVLGRSVSAKLTMDVHLANGMNLPSGTLLMGKVIGIHEGGASHMTRVSLLFNRARLKDGRMIPIKTTLLGAMPPSNSYYAGSGNYFPDESKPVAWDAKIIQQPGILSHVALHSAVESRSSGTFLSKRDDIHLPAGTQLRIAIAPLSASSGGAAHTAG